MRALEIIDKKCNEVIALHDYNWKRFYDRYDKMGNYNSMIFSFTRWRYKDFYPDGFTGE